MNCDNVKDLLPFIDDGDVEQDTVDAVKAHLEKCRDCSKEYGDINFVVNMVKSALTEPAVRPSPELLENVQRKIIEKKRVRYTRKWMFSTAAAVLFAAFVSMYGLLTRNVTQPVPFQVTMIEPDEEFDTYYADWYLDSYDLLELVNGVDSIDEYELNDIILSDDYLDISVDDIIETLDIDNLADFLMEGR